MAKRKQPKEEVQKNMRRNAVGRKGRQASMVTASNAEMSVAEVSAAVTPSSEETHPDIQAAAKSVMEEPVIMEPAVDTPVVAETSEEEIRKAKELLRAHGYGLIGYRDAGEKVKQTLGTGLDFVKGKWQRMSSWLSTKREEIRAKQEEKKRAAAEKKRLEDEEAARRAEAVKNELRLAELRVEEARLKIAAASTTVQHAEEPAHQPAAEAVVQPVAEKAQGAEVVTPADSDVPKCRACGAELVFGARFCRKCGKPVVSPA